MTKPFGESQSFFEFLSPFLRRREDAALKIVEALGHLPREQVVFVLIGHMEIDALETSLPTITASAQPLDPYRGNIQCRRKHAASRIAAALEHLPLAQVVYIVTSYIDLDDLEAALPTITAAVQAATSGS